MTIDYRAPDVVAQIKQATGDSLTLAVDTISEAETHRIAAAAMGPSGGKVVGLNGLGGLESGREDVATTGACARLGPASDTFVLRAAWVHATLQVTD